MLHHLRSGNYAVTINAVGAELHSFVEKHSQEEYIWQGDPAVWAGRAPVLFPIVGALKDNTALIDGKPFTINKHGFARDSEFQLVSANNDSLVLRLASDTTLYETYPWNFQLDVAFSLKNNTLTIEYHISNLDERPMLFNIGSHPAFRLPMDNCEHADYSIVFDKAETLALFKVVDGLIGTEPVPYLTNENSIRLNPDIFADDALVFRNIKSSNISLEHRTNGKRISVNTDNAPHLGIWAKPGAEYVCIEPWWGHADFTDSNGDLASKDSIQTLEPKDLYSTSISISVF